MNEIIKVEPVAMALPAPLTAVAMRQQVNLIQEVMREVMQVDQHYGVVPGCGNKPTLLKPGAEKLAMTFRLRPIIKEHGEDVKITQMENGHRDYLVFCHVYNMNGIELSTGVGSASTMESKYRYRNISDYELTGQPIPRDSKERKAEYRKQGFGMKKVDNEWVWVKYKEGEKSENPDIADTYNTVLKMAKKRAFVDGILSATGASDIFTQDIEDLPVTHAEPEHKPEPKAEAKTEMPQRKSASPTEPPVEDEKPKSTPKPERASDTTYKAKGKVTKFIPATGNRPAGLTIGDNPLMLKTFTDDTAEALARHHKEGTEVELDYKMQKSKNPKYPDNAMIVDGSIVAHQEAVAKEEEEDAPF